MAKAPRSSDLSGPFAAGAFVEHLVGLLWAEKPESAARHSLNEAIRVLRRYLGDASVETSGGLVRLLPDVVVLDTERLERFAESGQWQAGAS